MKFVGHQDRVSVLHLHPNQKSFISAAADGSISQWSIAEGRAIARFQGHEAAITAISTPDNPSLNQIATADQRGEVWLWNKQRSGGEHWRASNTRIEQLEFSPQADYLFTLPAGNREEGSVWKLNQGMPPQNVVQLPAQVCSSRWAGQGSELELFAFTETGDYLRWSPRTGRLERIMELSKLMGEVQFLSAELHPNGVHILGVTRNGAALLVNLDRKQVVPLTKSGTVRKAHFATKGTDVADVKILLGSKDIYGCGAMVS